MPDLVINTFTSSASMSTGTITAYQVTQPIGASDMFWYAKIYDVDGNLKYQSTIISDTSISTLQVPPSVTIDTDDYVNVVSIQHLTLNLAQALSLKALISPSVPSHFVFDIAFKIRKDTFPSGHLVLN